MCWTCPKTRRLRNPAFHYSELLSITILPNWFPSLSYSLSVSVCCNVIHVCDCLSICEIVCFVFIAVVHVGLLFDPRFHLLKLLFCYRSCWPTRGATGTVSATASPSTRGIGTSISTLNMSWVSITKENTEAKNPINKSTYCTGTVRLDTLWLGSRANSSTPVLRSRTCLFSAPAPPLSPIFLLRLQLQPCIATSLLYNSITIPMEVEISYLHPSILQTDRSKYLLKRLLVYLDEDCQLSQEKWDHDPQIAI